MQTVPPEPPAHALKVLFRVSPLQQRAQNGWARERRVEKQWRSHRCQTRGGVYNKAAPPTGACVPGERMSSASMGCASDTGRSGSASAPKATKGQSVEDTI